MEGLLEALPRLARDAAVTTKCSLGLASILLLVFSSRTPRARVRRGFTKMFMSLNVLSATSGEECKRLVKKYTFLNECSGSKISL